jgi:nitrite reductase/ring-hydroxylating ferredoxin subunit
MDDPAEPPQPPDRAAMSGALPEAPSAPGGTSGADPGAAPQRLCASTDLPERGRAWVWDVLEYGRPARAFALRFDGAVVAYLNRCAHVPTEMDWQPGEFLDSDRRWILCSIHGASYSPLDGRCVGGPCGKGRLQPVAVQDQADGVYWYPSRHIRPVPFDAPADESPP